MPTDIARTIETVWRIESTRLVATLARRFRDVQVAEDLAQGALVAALEQWPTRGVPDNPGAWLLTAARRRGVDHLRHGAMADSKHLALAHEPADEPSDRDDALDRANDGIGDDVLRLMFVACHPVLAPEARVALTLRLVGGLSTAEIARAFVVSEPTLAQRLVRAKRSLAEHGAAFEVPRGDELPERLDAVLDAICLVFNEGYTATAGDAWMRPRLCHEALRLGRILAELAEPLPPAQASEVHGLVALMEIQASRAPARTAPDGSPVLLLDQDRARWDQLLLRRGFAALARADRVGGPPGRYRLQAAIAACHGRAVRAEDTDWARIEWLYRFLEVVAPGPVVTLNRAVALGMAQGPAAGLAALDPLRDELAGYAWFWSARADLLARLDRRDEARSDLCHAIERTQNDRERALLIARRDALRAG